LGKSVSFWVLYEWERKRRSMDGGIVVRVRSAAAASTSTHWQQCSGSSSSSHLPLHKHTAAFFPCSR
jgi:hypothetical protein